MTLSEKIAVPVYREYVKQYVHMYPLTLLYKEFMMSFSVGSYFKDKDV